MLKLIQARFKDNMRGLIIVLLATVIVLPFACILVIVPLWLFTNTNASIWIMIIPISLFLLILFGGIFGLFAWILHRRKRWLDALFTPWGLTGKRYMLNGREYRGTVQGREVTVRFYRGPTLDILVGTSLKTRFGITNKSHTTSALADIIGQLPITLNSPDLAEFNISALDEQWIHLLLANPQAKILLLQLMHAGESWTLMPQLYLQPGMFHLRLYRNKNLFKYDIQPMEAQAWLDSLLELARIAEKLPHPQIIADESKAERIIRTGSNIGVVWGIVALLIGIPTCIMVLATIAFFVAAGDF